MKRFYASRLAAVSLGTLTICTGLSSAAAAAEEQRPEEASYRSDTDIVVTAQKREERVNDVPMSITAATGLELLAKGVTNVADMARLVPGLAVVETSYGTPTYYLRGVGFFQTAISAKPTVSTYLDEIPLPFPVMTIGTAFDVQRVEVLKGPQGTLFGQNATGGAINFVANKPTRSFEAGIDASFGRFNDFDTTAFVSGPLSDTVAARIVVRHEGSSGWQKSYTRPDTLGAKDMTQGRFLLAWEPASNLRINLNLNGFLNDSDTQAPQYISRFVAPTAFQSQPLLAQPLAPANARAADWNYRNPLRHDDYQVQGILRADYDVGDRVTLTSQTSYAYYKQNYGIEADGTPLLISDFLFQGNIKAFFQELRGAVSLPSGTTIIAGANYSREKTVDHAINNGRSESTAAHLGDPFGLPPQDIGDTQAAINFRNYAVFGNIDQDIGDWLTAHAGIRYTEQKTDIVDACSRSLGNNTFGAVFASLRGLPPLPAGSCISFDPATNSFHEFNGSLTEDNVSWRLGVDVKPAPAMLFYANVSRGFKGGGFTNLSATQFAQYAPARQEKLTAYEAGAKLTLLDRRLQLNGAIFYYDYVDKQLQGRVPVPPLGALEKLVNVPKSRVKGAEFEIVARPVPELTINLGGTYLDTKITSDFNSFTQLGVAGNFRDAKFPFTSDWQINGSIDYKQPVTPSLNGYGGIDVNYRSKANADFIPNPVFDIDPYFLIDLRAGVEAADGTWRAGLYVRNLTDKYYWTSVVRRLDTVNRYAGMPRTYGITASFRFK